MLVVIAVLGMGVRRHPAPRELEVVVLAPADCDAVQWFESQIAGAVAVGGKAPPSAQLRAVAGAAGESE